MEALRLVPPEILRFLVANSKPSKAIEFDTGMGLVNLADEFERLAARDLERRMELADNRILELVEQNQIEEKKTREAMEERISFFERELNLNPFSWRKKKK